MARLSPRPRAEVPELEAELEFCAEFLGFVPNDVLTMAHLPGLVSAFTQLCRAVYQVPGVDPGLMQLIGTIVSWAAGCRYCTAHMAQTAPRFGVTQEKIDALWEFERNELFSDAERAALRVAFAAGQSPSAVTDAEVQALQAHFDAAAIAQIFAVIGLFGFLNRWNDSLATTLEAAPLEYGSRHLGSTTWDPGKHMK